MNNEFSILHWVYVLSMLTGSTIVFIMSRKPKGVPKIEYFISFFIPIWSAIAYMAMALGQGMLEVENQIAYYSRYLDWVVTTPLLLLSLALVAMNNTKKDKILILSLVGADVIMVLCGLIGDLSSGINRYIWFFVGMIAFFIILWIIWVSLSKVAKSQGNELYKLYIFLAGYLTIFWIGYPTTWILGPSGLGIVPQRIDTYLFVILPIFSKVGFGLLSLNGLRKLKK